MHEGPEVKRITERINDFFQDTTLESIEVVVPRYGEKQLRGEVAEFQSALPLQIESVQCKGKFIYFTLENGWTVWNTLGMSGTWRKNKVKHTMLTFHTSKERCITKICVASERSDFAPLTRNFNRSWRL